jgi:hypothetical protein
MKKSRFTDSQIIAVLKQADAGASVPDLCRHYKTPTNWTAAPDWTARAFAPSRI